MRPGILLALAAAGAAAATACATHRVATSTAATTITTSAPGEVVVVRVPPMWIDTVGGTWIDSTGMLWIAGPTGTRFGLLPADVAALSDANIAGHIAMGDSLEIALAHIGLAHVENADAHNFLRRTLTAHTDHLAMTEKTARQAGLTPLLLPADTADAAIARNLLARLSTASPSAEYDRRFMRTEVVVHQHFLHDLLAMRPRATGATEPFATQTMSMVQQHLADARRIWQEVGGTPATP